MTIHAPCVPLVANVTAKEETDPATIRRLLVEQVTGMVRWRESVIAMKTLGVERIAELGTGKALTGMIKRIDPEIACVPVGTPADIETFLKTL